MTKFINTKNNFGSILGYFWGKKIVFEKIWLYHFLLFMAKCSDGKRFLRKIHHRWVYQCMHGWMDGCKEGQTSEINFIQPSWAETGIQKRASL